MAIFKCSVAERLLRSILIDQKVELNTISHPLRSRLLLFENRAASDRSRFYIKDRIIKMRYKTVLQHDARDCGAACLATIANYYKSAISLSYSRRICKTDYLGTNLYGLVDAAKTLGFKSIALRGTKTELTEGISSGEIMLPFIASVVNEQNLNHFIVVFAVQRGNFICGDPARGTIKLPIEVFYSKWTGYIVTIQTGKSFPSDLPKANRTKEWLSLLSGSWKKLVVVSILSLIISGIGIAGAFVFELVLDNYTEVHFSAELTEIYTAAEHDEDEILSSYAQNILGSNFSTIFMSITFLYIVQGLIQYCRGRLVLTLSKEMDVRIITGYYSHIQDMSVESVRVMRIGEYLSRLSDAAAVRDAISTLIVAVLLDMIMVIGCGFFLFRLNYILFLISLIVLLIYAMIVLLYKTPLERTNRAVMENNAEVQSFFKESIDGFETIHAAVAEKEAKAAMNSKYHHFANSVVKNGLLSVSMDAISDTSEMVGIMVMLWVGFVFVKSGSLSLGSLMTFYALMGYFSTPAKDLINLQPVLERAKIAFDRIKDVTDTEPERANDTNVEIPKNVSMWSAAHMDFRYGNHKLVLQDISFHVAKGEKIAFVGESGCGKTTIAKLIMHFYRPEKGQLMADGVDTVTYRLDSIRKAIAYVPQETFLFSDTLRNNLTLGITASDDEILAVCSVCNLDSLTGGTASGLNTQIEENGVNLSGGQQQRIAIARALLRKPQLLILDEATSHLDLMTERVIQNSIDAVSDNLACIVITHRLATVAKCDRIYVIKDGVLAGCGPHDELLKTNEYYAALWLKGYGNV